MQPAQEIFDVIRAGDRARLEALLATDPQAINARSDRGHTPILIAQYHHKKDLVQVLLAAGPELDIFDAASVGRTNRVAELLDADPALVNAYSNDGFFPLALAAFFGHPETVALLLARGADVTQVARNPMRVQALHSGVASRSFEVARLLVDAGAPLDTGQQEGWTPLHAAVHHGDVELTRYFLAHGADPKQQNEKGQSAIGLAAEQPNAAELLKVLKSSSPSGTPAAGTRPAPGRS